jgi:2-polyprenyl-3-methyl-5-hydroxy-6-metoxy-1,4-benzoquinol methylase
VASVALAKLGYQMTGVDPAPRALDEARMHARRGGVEDRTVFQEGELLALNAPFEFAITI